MNDLEFIYSKVKSFYNSEIYYCNRYRENIIVKRAFIYLIYKFTPITFKRISRILDYDHSTIIYHYQLADTLPIFDNEYKNLRRLERIIQEAGYEPN